MQVELSQLREFLKTEFQRRKSFKPMYSMRAYARDMDLSLTSLNSFMAGKRDLNLRNVDKVFRYLNRQSPIRCSWCGVSKRQSKLLIGGPKAQYICQSCVRICNDILAKGRIFNADGN